MSTRTHTNQKPNGYGVGVLLIRWTGLLNGDDGDWIAIPEHRDITVQVLGTFGAGGSLQFEGTNEDAVSPASPIILRDTRAGANTLVFTSGGLQQCLEAPFRIRPRVTAGDGSTSLTAIVLARRSRG